jgi:hypothetical protein
MGAVEPTDTPWQHQPMHRSEKSDIFRTSGNNPIHIKVEIGTMARNLLLEEFPLAERELTRIKGDKWLLETDIYRLEGAGRFIIGVANDIKIIESEPLKSYLQKFIDEHCKKIAN